MSTTALVIGADVARASLAELDGYDEIVVLDTSAPELERLLTELDRKSVV